MIPVKPQIELLINLEIIFFEWTITFIEREHSGSNQRCFLQPSGGHLLLKESYVMYIYFSFFSVEVIIFSCIEIRTSGRVFFKSSNLCCSKDSCFPFPTCATLKYLTVCPNSRHVHISRLLS